MNFYGGSSPLNQLRKYSTRLLPFAFWPDKSFSGQSEAGNSNASGTGSVRVSAQGLVSI